MQGVRRCRKQIYATIARLGQICGSSPESTERMAWISARHPRTFRGPSRRSSSLPTWRCLADFRLLLAEPCSWRTESVQCVVFCLIAMFKATQARVMPTEGHNTLSPSYLRSSDSICKSRGIATSFPLSGSSHPIFGLALRPVDRRISSAYLTLHHSAQKNPLAPSRDVRHVCAL